MKKHILTIFLLGTFFLGFSQETDRIIATLSDTIKNWDLLVNGQPIYTIKSGELFYYYPKIETACSENRMAGKIPLDKVKRIDTLKYLRFEFTESDLEFKDYHEDLILAKRNGIDYKELVYKAINKDGKALKKILKKESLVDGAATEMFADRFWKVIHFWSDEELSKLLKNDTSGFTESFSEFMTNEFYTGFTEKETEEYLSLFYPNTLILMNLNKK